MRVDTIKPRRYENFQRSAPAFFRRKIQGGSDAAVRRRPMNSRGAPQIQRKTLARGAGMLTLIAVDRSEVGKPETMKVEILRQMDRTALESRPARVQARAVGAAPSSGRDARIACWMGPDSSRS